VGGGGGGRRGGGVVFLVFFFWVVFVLGLVCVSVGFCVFVGLGCGRGGGGELGGVFGLFGCGVGGCVVMWGVGVCWVCLVLFCGGGVGVGCVVWGSGGPLSLRFMEVLCWGL